MKRPKPFKETKGVKWFHVRTEKDRPTTPKGSVRKNFEPGIYLESIQVRKR